MTLKEVLESLGTLIQTCYKLLKDIGTFWPFVLINCYLDKREVVSFSF